MSRWAASSFVLIPLAISAWMVWAIWNSPQNVCRRAGYLIGEEYQGHIYCSAPFRPPSPDAVMVR